MKLSVSKYVSEKIKRSKDNFRVDTFYAGGKGGQKQNKTETGVRITDLVTGLFSESREHRTQYQNKKEAWKRLVKCLVEFYEEEEKKDKDARFKSEAKEVRVYKEKSSMVVCGITGNKYNYENTLNGDLTPIIVACRDNEHIERS